MPTDTTEDRLTELEIKVTYQDEIIAALNEVTIELRKQVEALTARFDAAEEESAKDSAPAMPHERPPHY